MDGLVDVIQGAVTVLIAAASAWYGRREYRRRLRATPRAQLAEAGTEAGRPLVRVNGTVELLEALVAPISGRACAYWDIQVVEGRLARIKTLRSTDSTPFLLRDGSGDALVDPRFASVTLGTLDTGRITIEQADDRVRAFLAAVRFETSGPMFYKTFRCVETIIEPGTTVAVIGRPGRDVDPGGVARAAGYRDLPPTRAQFSSGRGEPLIIADDPGLLGDVALAPA